MLQGGLFPCVVPSNRQVRKQARRHPQCELLEMPERRRKLSPYPSRSFTHSLELTSFLVDGKVVSKDRRGKATLRAERQAFQRHKAARLGDTTDEVFQRLDLRPFGADQSEHHHLVVRDMPERCKRARP